MTDATFSQGDFCRMTFFRVLLFPLLAISLSIAGTAAISQERPNTILVLDGSGSMWGQIDGINKIVIARDVVGDLLDTFPENQNLGLTVYGHRERGNCADIETVVAPGPDTLGAIREAVNGINPRGKTPMTDAVIAAAEALRFTEEKATVILVSDGIETCNPDPCAAARALEQAGVDFTAHVIGFDVTDPEALAQMQCLADETGGTFRSAADAAELSEALTTVAVAEPDPVPQTARIVAVYQPGGAEIEAAIDWTVSNGEASEDGSGPGFEIDLMAGDYVVRGTRLDDGHEANGAFSVASATEAGDLRVEVIFPEPPAIVDVTFEARLGSEAGPLVDGPVLWTLDPLPDAVTAEAEGNALTLSMGEASYEVTAYWVVAEQDVNRQFIATPGRTVTVVFEAPPASATITGPATAIAGSTIEVGWTGPDSDLDYIGIGPEDGDGVDLAQNFTYTRDGSPLELLVPIGEGPFEIRYIQQQGRGVLGSAPITVLPVEATLTAPEEAIAGSTIEVSWLGPDYRNDYIGIGRVDADGADLWENFTYTREGSTLDLQVPVTPGDYMIAYYTDQGRVNIGEVPIRVTEVTATLSAPATAVVGETIDVGWTGPDYDLDYIGIGQVGARMSDVWENWTYTREGNPTELLIPTEEGDYLIQYFLAQDRTAIASVPITVGAVGASVTAPAEAVAGSTIEVSWTGPDNQNDYIGIGVADADGADRWDNLTYTRDGSPLDLQLPTEPGAYVIRYFLAQDRVPIAETAISLAPVTASLSAPAEAMVGETIDVAWTGPDYRNDYIGIGPVDADRSEAWESLAYTNKGSPAELQLPTEPGNYVIQYFLGQDRSSLTSLPITLVAIGATLSAPAEATAGDTIDVTWTGPDYTNDYIGIGLVDAERNDAWENFAYSKDGSPAELLVPTTPGDYVIQYFLGQDRSSLARIPITVTAVGASLAAPETAIAGDTIDVTWTGPDYYNDYIGIGLVGADRNAAWENFAYAKDGSPIEILVPTTPGDYVIQYFLGQDRTSLAEIPITVSPVEASLSAPGTAVAGDTIDVTWTGPDYYNDYIGIGPVDAERNAAWENFAYAKDGAPAELLIPTTPGDYVIRYFLGQDRSSIAEVPISVTAVTATLAAPASAPAGSEIDVAWEGPDYYNDYIGIGRVGAERNAAWEAFAYTNAGSPATIRLPETPGDYVIRYFLGQDRSTIAERPLTVE